MDAWVGWLLLSGLLILAELFTSTFYLLMIAFGVGAGAIAELVGLSLEWQFVAAAIVSVAGTVVVRTSRFGKWRTVSAARDSNVNLDIGQTINVDHWHGESNSDSMANVGFYKARAKYRGALWDVELAIGEEPHSGQFTIQEIRGSHLIVASHSDK
ncbi:MAG: NfeD family protein [Glaciimonas sp.]|nr:NfeD family protein [Glaciimonas sp.]